MKRHSVFAGLLAASLLFSGCSGQNTPQSTDTDHAYQTLQQQLAVWQDSQALSLDINGSIFAEYNKTPSAVSFSGIHQQKPGDNGQDLYSVISFRYGNDSAYNYYYLTDGTRYVAALEDSSSSTEAEPMYYAEELDCSTFEGFLSYAIPTLVFTPQQVEAATEQIDRETGAFTIHFTLEPDACANEAIMLLEQLQYINTSTADITCAVSKMSCDAVYTDDQLQSISYSLNCDLTCEGEVMSTSCQITHSLYALGDDVSFTMPDPEAVLSGTT